ncbi:uncharacterized protein LOC135287005 isoform X2 [Passer domesticus]|uniref:uncharacterized protein LOC135287005 isoform X2 n=1 Tax=Passer domesticus TaxID=48849 RepID=UPI0030FF00A6
MAAFFLLLLLLLLGAQATAPAPCQGDASSWCWDTATVTRCGWEQQCQHLRDSLALGNVGDGDSVADGDSMADTADGDSVADTADGDSVADTADGDSMAQRKVIKCFLCTKVLKKIQKLAGDNPDESAVAAALQKGCQALGRVVGRVCQKLVKSYQEQITKGLQNGDMPRDICAAMGICQS